VQNNRLVVVIRVNEACNFKCPFCAYRADRAFQRHDVNLSVLIPFISALGEHSASTGQEVHVSWLGGEPLLWRNIKEASTAARSAGLTVGVTTNFSYRSQSQIKTMLHQLAEITISIDGVPETHAMLRQRPIAEVRHAMSLISELSRIPRRTFLLRVNSILTKYSVDQFDHFVTLLQDIGVDELTLNVLGGRANAHFAAENSMSSDQWRGFKDKLIQYQSRLNSNLNGLIIVGSLGYWERIDRQVDGYHYTIEYCDPGSKTLFVESDGAMSTCSFTLREMGANIADTQTAGELRKFIDRMIAARRKTVFEPCTDCRDPNACGKYKHHP
jgi:sulfatase maturation enzyme AslB (radical SAM superfamily)